MNNLANALHQAGLVDEKSFSLAEARRQLSTETKKSDGVPLGTYDLEDLVRAVDVAEFKEMALDLIKQDSRNISHVVQMGHRAMLPGSSDDDRKKLRWFVLQVREASRSLGVEGEFEEYLRLAFRRANPVVSLRDYFAKKERGQRQRR